MRAVKTAEVCRCTHFLHPYRPHRIALYRQDHWTGLIGSMKAIKEDLIGKKILIKSNRCIYFGWLGGLRWI